MCTYKAKLMFLTFIFLCGSTSPILAQGGGTDMYTRSIELLGLFNPHPNNCNAATELFVPIFSTFGFCIEKDERQPLRWDLARQNCLLSFKRLPELAEWQAACPFVNLLNDMEDDWEWTSNFAIPGGSENGTGYVTTGQSGYGQCQVSGIRQVTKNAPFPVPDPGPLAYRCVR